MSFVFDVKNNLVKQIFFILSFLGATRELAKTNDGVGLPPVGRVRLSSRRGQSGHQHRPKADGNSQTLPRKSAKKNVRKRQSEVINFICYFTIFTQSLIQI